MTAAAPPLVLGHDAAWSDWVEEKDRALAEAEYEKVQAETDQSLTACGGSEGGCSDHSAHIQWACRHEDTALELLERWLMGRILGPVNS